MSSTLLTYWTVYYADDAGSNNTGYKQIRWTDSTTYPPETYTTDINDLYSALMNLFSLTAQNDARDSTPMRAVTPTVYEIGSFDAGDLEPWFIDPVSVRHLTGGGLNTVNWTRTTGATATEGKSGILKVPYTTGTQFVTNDLGRTVTNGTTSSSGTLLYFANNEAWIRPTDSTSAHDWTGSTGTITVTGGTGSVTQSGPGVSGERIWSNLYSIGSIYSGSQLYVAQNYSTFSPWWSTGHLDRLFLTSDGFASGLIDYGLLTVFAREYGYVYDHFTADLSGGGRSPVPLATSADVNNTTALATIAALSGITFTFGDSIQNLGNGNGDRPYDVEINCGGNSIADFYEYTKWATRRSATTPLSTSTYQGGSPAWGRDGEQYLGAGEIIIYLDTVTVALTEGDTITGATSGATGVLVSSHTTPLDFLVVKEVRGTFVDNETITDEGSGSVTSQNTNAVESITLSKVAPFGTFAGSQFFGARGVYLYNMAGADANNYVLLDSTNTQQAPPATVAITVSNTLTGDRVSVYRADDTSGNIDKDYLISHSSSNTVGNSLFVVSAGTPIPTDTPSSGILRVVDDPSQKDHRFRYASWSGSIFTLVTTGIPSGTIDSAGNNASTTFRATSANLANILPGDIVRNTSDSPDSWAHVISVTLVSGSTYDVVHTPLQGGTTNTWGTSDTYEFNTLPVTYDGSDTAYVPYIESTATGTSVSTSVQYASDRFISTRVRIKGMQPYTNNTSQLTSSGYSTSVTRIPDTIVT